MLRFVRMLQHSCFKGKNHSNIAFNYAWIDCGSLTFPGYCPIVTKVATIIPAVVFGLYVIPQIFPLSCFVVTNFITISYTLTLGLDVKCKFVFS